MTAVLHLLRLANEARFNGDHQAADAYVERLHRLTDEPDRHTWDHDMDHEEITL